MIRLELAGTPLPYRSPFVGTKGAWNPRTPVMGQMKAILRGLMIEKGYQLIPGAVAVECFFLMPIPKATSKRARMFIVNGFTRPTKRPDRGNCLKLLEDVLQGVVIEEDSMVVDGRVAKYYDDTPRTLIHVYHLWEYDKFVLKGNRGF